MVVPAPSLTILVLSTLCAALPGWGVEAEGRIDSCIKQLRSYENGRPGYPTHLELHGRDGGELRYIGVRHTLDPADPQIYAIEREFEGFRPSRVFFEGHDSEIESERDQIIRKFGASGFVRFLADQSGTPVASLEPPPQVETGHLTSRFEPQQIQMFFLLREVVRLRERHDLTRDEVGQALESILADSELPGIANPIASMEDLDRAFWSYWRYPKSWWDASAGWFDPFFSSADTGGVFTNEIARESAQIRDENMVRVLTAAVLEEERVLAIVGRDHLPMQAPALRCAIE